jgi:hypothetical protein
MHNVRRIIRNGTLTTDMNQWAQRKQNCGSGLARECGVSFSVFVD